MTAYTKDQELIVEKILSHKADYYRCLSVEKDSNDVEIKKAYRKIALKVHPDKNRHPNAPEAFKACSKAFEVLSDPSKKRIYDQTGRDPGSRPSMGETGGGGFPEGFSGFQRGGGGAFPFGDVGGQQFFFGGNDINEDIFNIFFGGAPGGTTGFAFGPGGGFTTFGGAPQGFRRRRTTPSAGAGRGGGAGGRGGTGAREKNEENDFDWSQLLSVVLILGIMLLSSLLTPSQKPKAPEYSFMKKPPFEVERTTSGLNVNYFISKEMFEKSNIKELKQLDKKVESVYIKDLDFRCSMEQENKEQILREAYGFFFNDEEKIRRGENYPMPACEEMKARGLL